MHAPAPPTQLSCPRIKLDAVEFFLVYVVYLVIYGTLTSSCLVCLPRGLFQPTNPESITCAFQCSGFLSLWPLSNELGIYKTVKAGFWRWLSGKSPSNLVSCSLSARKGSGASDTRGARALAPRPHCKAVEQQCLFSGESSQPEQDDARRGSLIPNT